MNPFKRSRHRTQTSPKTRVLPAILPDFSPTLSHVEYNSQRPGRQGRESPRRGRRQSSVPSDSTNRFYTRFVEPRLTKCPLNPIPTVAMRGAESCKSRYNFEMFSWDQQEDEESSAWDWDVEAEGLQQADAARDRQDSWLRMDVHASDSGGCSHSRLVGIAGSQSNRADSSKRHGIVMPTNGLTLDIIQQYIYKFASEPYKRRQDDDVLENVKRKRAEGKVIR
ncbi:uncharacterized protein L203_104337 [Cryptococcus depauperatus CBS 7841]|uniref:Uncharacterized protein n=1 Tax=Cryptococcus depauperatus CBS 7841 TaxID=1295531 RepID=A0A1E3IFV7_9TREE|nr:hypothetical protein L203_03271 [Cryptococcus depauperatus CBS 7841]